jgi:hypothetical protein
MIIAKELNSIEYGGIMEEGNHFSEVSEDTENERIYQRRAAIGMVFFLFVVIFILCMVAIYGGINPKGLVLRETFRVRNSTRPRTTTPAPTNATITIAPKAPVLNVGNINVTLNIIDKSKLPNNTKNITAIFQQNKDSSSSINNDIEYINNNVSSNNSYSENSSSNNSDRSEDDLKFSTPISPSEEVSIEPGTATDVEEMEKVSSGTSNNNSSGFATVESVQESKTIAPTAHSASSLGSEKVKYIHETFNLRHARRKVRRLYRFLDTNKDWLAFHRYSL